MQAAPESTTFQYDANYWTTANTLNTQHDTPQVNVDAKLSAFNTMALASLKVCSGSSLANAVCYEYDIPSSGQTALDLFNSGFQPTIDLDQQRWEQVFRHTQLGHAQGHSNGCGMQRPGFNIQCNDRNWARWGYCDNDPGQCCQPNDFNDADRAIGIGLAGQDGSYGSAGVVGHPGPGAWGPSTQMWLYGAAPRDYTLLMQAAPESTTFQYDANYWTTP